MSTETYGWHLDRLQESCAELLPEARLQIAIERVSNPIAEQVKLVNAVAVIEAVSRSWLVHHATASRAELEATYLNYRDSDAETLISEMLSAGGAESAEYVFGADVWETFKYALRYRDLMVHEALFLGIDRTSQLIEATTAVTRVLIGKFNIPLPPPPSVPSQATSNQEVDDNSVTVDEPSGLLAPDSLLSKLFDFGERMTTLLISAGYVGFLAAWSFMHSSMCRQTEFWVALLFVLSLSIFVFWHAFNMRRMSTSAFQFTEDVKEDPTKAAEAFKRFSKKMGNPHSPYQRAWVKFFFPLTIYLAMAGAVIMAVAFAHGLLVGQGFDLPTCVR